MLASNARKLDYRSDFSFGYICTSLHLERDGLASRSQQKFCQTDLVFLDNKSRKSAFILRILMICATSRYSIIQDPFGQ